MEQVGRARGGELFIAVEIQSPRNTFLASSSVNNSIIEEASPDFF